MSEVRESDSSVPSVDRKHQPRNSVDTQEHQPQQTQTQTQQDTKAAVIMLRKKNPRSTLLFVLLGVMGIAMMIFVAVENDSNDLNVEHSIALLKSEDNNNFDAEGDDLVNDAGDPDKPTKYFSFWDRHTSTRIQRKDTLSRKNSYSADDHKSHKKKHGHDKHHHKSHRSANSKSTDQQRGKHVKPHAMDEAIPVINFADDAVPHAALPPGTILKAADALLCEATVIDYVINATDLRDECDGLQKAFESSCTAASDDEGEKSNSGRRLYEDISWNDQQQQQQQQQPYYHTYPNQRSKNPIKAIQSLLHTSAKRLRHWQHGPEGVFMSEDAILNEWDDAKYETENDLVEKQYKFRDSINMTRILRNLEELKNSQQDAIAPATPGKNKTVTSRPKANLNMPMANHHISQKAFAETLMLQKDDKEVANAIFVMNETATNISKAAESGNAAAVASAKAVSDTLDAVNAVLNNPSAIEARTCCTSILTVYQENCRVDEEEELSDRRLFIVVAVIALCGLVKSLIRHFDMMWLPEAAGCILVGVLSGWMLASDSHHDISFDGNWFLRIMVPPIVFEAAISIDKRSFNRHIVPILIFAVIGTVFATAVTAGIVHKGSQYFHSHCETIPYIDALAFGALISSIDPIAVLSVLSNMGMTDTDTIYVLIFGESLLNDGVAIVLFETLVHFLDDHLKVDTHAVIAATIHFFVVAVGSLAVGVASGYCATVYYWIMHGCQTPLVEVLMFFCWALIPYYICDGIEWSGIVAVVATGFVMDVNIVGPRHGAKLEHSSGAFEDIPQSSGKARRPLFSKIGHLSTESKTHVGFVTEIVATTMETAIFAYLGLFLFSSRYHWNFYHTGLAIAGCSVSRAIMIPILSTVANWVTRMQQGGSCQAQNLPQQQSQISPGRPAGVIVDKKMQLVLWFAGLRGAMSFALVENIPLYDTATGQGSRVKSELKAMTSASIVFTVFILGGGTYYMMESLGMAPSSGSKPNRKQTLSAGSSIEMESLMTPGDTAESNDCDEEIMTKRFGDGNGGNNTTIPTFRQRSHQREETT